MNNAATNSIWNLTYKNTNVLVQVGDLIYLEDRDLNVQVCKIERPSRELPYGRIYVAAVVGRGKWFERLASQIGADWKAA